MKTSRLMVRFVLIACLMASGYPAVAQGTAFTYQGRLNDGSNAANGHYDLRFVLFDVSEFGNPVAPILTNGNVAVSDGLFTTALDFGANSFTGTVRYLEIGVRTNGSSGLFTTLVPRQAILPSPYAVFSANADLLDGFSASASPTANTLLALDSSARLPNSVLNTGSGNGLDADLLDGLNSTAFLLAGGKAVDADLLDGLDSTSFWKTTGNGGTTPGTHFLGTTDNQAVELRVNGVRALRLQPTPIDSNHSNIVNVIGGSSLNSVATNAYGATIGGGGMGKFFSLTSIPNTIAADFGTIGGGRGNSIRSNLVDSTIGGGFVNEIRGSDQYGLTIAGGYQNTIIGSGSLEGGSTIGGGVANLIGGLPGSSGIVLGGGDTIAGGVGNAIASNVDFSTIGGGQFNFILPGAYSSVVGGGYRNTNSGQYATIPGGEQNVAAGDYSLAAGRRAKANHDGAFVWADSQNADFVSTATNQFLIRASGGVGIGKNNPSSALDVLGTVTATAFVGSLDVTNLHLPLAQTATSGADLINLTQTGTGDCAQFNIVNPANVGEALEARTDGAGDAIQAVNTGTGRAGYFQISNSGSGSPTLYATGNGSGPTVQAVSTGSGKALVADGTSQFNGNVGIGTATPATPLEVNGSASATQFLAGISAAVAPGYAFQSDTDTGVFRPAANALALATAGAERLRINSAGNVAIGVVGGSSDATLHVQNTTGATRPIKCDRVGTDGELLAFARDDTLIGNITVAGGVVSYNAFTGSHYAWLPRRLERGTLVTMTGENRRAGEDGEVIYGVSATTRENDPACLGAYLAPHSTAESPLVTDEHQIMSVGNGELWVTQSKTGDLQPGDFLISSGVTGCAMKDDPEQFPIGYICARAAERVRWADVTAGANGIKRIRISVLFEGFVRDSRGSGIQVLSQQMEKRDAKIQKLEKQNADLQKRLERLERLMNERILAGN